MNPNLYADFEQIHHAIELFRWAITGLGIAIFFVGLFMYFYKPKDENKQSTQAARLTALISFGLIGIGTVIYAWIWFGRQ